MQMMEIIPDLTRGSEQVFFTYYCFVVPLFLSYN
uniref:Uncharacterized protein n=1 Tax=Arundo donax TaxID=35708 RepID=A0A0A8YN73_ARUDO